MPGMRAHVGGLRQRHRGHVNPREQAEIQAVAVGLDKFGMTHSAARLRALLGEPCDDERPCKVQDASGHVHAIPWGLAEILYPAYGHDQSLERLHERGGFGRGELGQLAVDAYGGRRGRLARWPLLDLYDMAKRP